MTAALKSRIRHLVTDTQQGINAATVGATRSEARGKARAAARCRAKAANLCCQRAHLLDILDIR